MAATHVVMTGNPGVGKSTIANTLMGHVAFESGIRIENPSGKLLQTCMVNGVTYSDTPGLDTMTERKKAAHEISQAINAQTRLKIIFVTTLESGRIRPADVATVEVILQAVEAVGVNSNARFSLIVNCCDDGQLEQLGNAQTAQFVKTTFGAGRTLSHALFLPSVAALKGSRNKMFVDRARLTKFVDEAPFLTVEPNVNVRAEAYDESFHAAEAELERLKAELENVQSSPWWYTFFVWAVSGIAFYLGRAAIVGLRFFL